jgi:hypothetical protein
VSHARQCWPPSFWAACFAMEAQFDRLTLAVSLQPRLR